MAGQQWISTKQPQLSQKQPKKHQKEPNNRAKGYNNSPFKTNHTLAILVRVIKYIAKANRYEPVGGIKMVHRLCNLLIGPEHNQTESNNTFRQK